MPIVSDISCHVANLLLPRVTLPIAVKNSRIAQFQLLFEEIGASMNNTKVTVYYDGLCVLCSREIDHYRGSKGSDLINFVDICAPGFDSSAHGLDPKAVHRVMHVKRADGTLATEVDAFITIWTTLPGYWLLARISKLRLVKFFLNIGYQLFVRVRPYLPRRSLDIYACADSPYCDVSDQKNSTPPTK
jgi:predicted DCC family thiol-disulfide oxidoreductase YuxK